MNPIRIELASVVAAMTLAATAARAHAHEARASLVVTRGEGAEDCPNTDALAARMTAIAGQEIASPADAEPRATWINVELLRVLAGYRAVISTRGERKGTRTIEDVGSDCKSLSDAVAIALVMLLDPGVSLEPKPAPPTPVANVTPEPAPPQADPAARSARAAADFGAAEPRSTAPRFGAEASGGATLAVLEHAVPLLEGGARLRLGWWSFGTGVGYVFPDRVADDRVAEAPRGVELELVYAYARACGALFTNEQSRLELCAEPMAGSLRGEGDGYSETDPRRLLWSAVAATAELYTRLSGPLLWSARVRVLVPVVRHGFSVELPEGRARAFTMPPLGGTLSLGVATEL